MAQYKDRYFNSPDGVRLHYRDYSGPHAKPPLLCLHGLTRNARDFEPVADAFAGNWRLIVPSFRGRGLSANDPDPKNYEPSVYVGDILKLLDQLGIADAVFVGTSLGGIVTMLLAQDDEERIAGALLNDIGPELVQDGIARIGEYVGKPIYFDRWEDAAKTYAERLAGIYPKWGLPEWDRFARRTLREEEDGRLGLDYDMAIRENFLVAADATPVDAWYLLDGLDHCPVTILRGALSDLFSEEVAERMARELPDCELVTVPEVGHAPSFDEPESIAALARLLARVEAKG